MRMGFSFAISAVVFAAIVLTSASVASGQESSVGILEEQRLEGAGQEFGTAIDVDGDILAVGIPGEASFGAVQLYSRTETGWQQLQRLEPDTGPPTDANDFIAFGHSIDLDGDTLVVGAPSVFGGNASSVFVFTRVGDTWELQQRLQLDGPGNDLFGVDVGISGDTLVVGSLAEIGRVLVYTRIGDEWNQVQEIVADIAAPTDLGFGRSVALQGETLVIGNDGFGGRVDVYSRVDELWVESQVISTGETFDENFGRFVSLDEDTLAIGRSSFAQDSDTTSGTVLVLTREAGVWIEQDEIQTGTVDGFFNQDIALDGDTIVVGRGDDIGSVDLFIRSGDGWTREAEFVPSIPPRRTFSGVIAIGEGQVFAGFPQSEVVFIFDQNSRDVTAACNGHDVTVLLAAGDQPTDGPDVILGTDGPDVINAGAGNDIICSGDGDGP